MCLYEKLIFKQLLFFLLKTNIIYIELLNTNFKKKILEYFKTYFNKNIFLNLIEKNIYYLNENNISIFYIINEKKNKKLIIIEILKNNKNINIFLKNINFNIDKNTFIIILYKYIKNIEINNKYNNFLINKNLFNKNKNNINLFFKKKIIINNFLININYEDVKKNIESLILIYIKILKLKLINYNSKFNKILNYINTNNIKYLINILIKYHYIIQNYKNIDIYLLSINIINYIKLYPERELNPHS